MINKTRTSGSKFRLMRQAQFAILFSLLAGPSSAQWVALSQGNTSISHTLSSDVRSQQQVTVTVPGYEINTIEVNGKKYSVVTVPEYPTLTVKGAPDLPRVSANYLISQDQVPAVQSVTTEYEDIKLDYPLISSKGHFTRDISPESIPYTFSEIYEKDSFYPEMRPAEVSNPFVIHNVRGVNVHYNLFQYNPVKQTLRVHKTINLSFDKMLPKKKTTTETKVPSFVDRIISKGFVNYKNMVSPLGLRDANESGRMVIICFDEFVEAAQPFATWKQKAGIPVKMVKMSEVGTTAEEIKAFVQAEFAAGGLGYLHLIGDVEQIPTLRGTVERAHSDQAYGLLAGDDWFLDIIVSRFSAKSSEEVAYQVAKSIQYEAKPDTSESNSWYRKGTGIASNEGKPKDWAYADVIRDGLMSFTYDAIDQIYDPNASKTMVGDAVNDGRSVINYIGHGSSTQWVTSRFSNDDVKALSNGAKLPYIWSVACVNGAFAGWKDSFAETWMKAGSADNVKGAVAVAAASTNMQWVPPLYWQAETNLVVLPQGKDQSFGGLSIGGMARIAEKYGPDHRSFKMFVEQTNNFGDGSLKVRYDTPKKLELGNVDVTYKVVTGVVSSPDGAPLAGLNVTVYDAAMGVYERTKTTVSGKFEFDLAKKQYTELSLTVTGTNVVPVVDFSVPLSSKQEETQIKNFKKLY